MKTSVVCVLAVVLVGAVVVTAPVGAIDREHLRAMRGEAQTAITEMQITAAAAKAGKTVLVRCDKGESVQAALDKNPGPVTIEIQGICAENVRIERRSDVTLRGKHGDPSKDGLTTAQGSGTRTYALDVWYTRGLVLEGLSFSNGTNGAALRFSEATISSCQFNENQVLGLRLERLTLVLEAHGIDASRNGGRGVDIAWASVLQCQSCTMIDNATWAAGTFDGGFATFWNSEVRGRDGLFALDNDSYIDIDCVYGSEPELPCVLAPQNRAGQAWNGGTMAVLGVTFSGKLGAFNDGSTVSLINSHHTGIVQAVNGAVSLVDSDQLDGEIDLSGSSTLFVEGGFDNQGNLVSTSTLGPITLRDWSRATFAQGSLIGDSVSCSDAAGAINTGAAIAEGVIVSGCDHWTQ